MVKPGQVNTTMTALFEGKLTWAVPTPSTFVQSAITTLGFSASTCGYWPHSLQSWVLFRVLLPEWAIAAARLKCGKQQYRHAMNMKSSGQEVEHLNNGKTTSKNGFRQRNTGSISKN